MIAMLGEWEAAAAILPRGKNSARRYFKWVEAVAVTDHAMRLR